MSAEFLLPFSRFAIFQVFVMWLTLGLFPRVVCSLAWLEMRTALAKLVWSYDWKLVNEGVDWHRNSRMLTLWQKPPLWVKVTPCTRV